MNKYECLVKAKGQQVTVNVFLPANASKDEIKEQAVVEAERFSKELGSDFRCSDLVPIGYKDCGKFPLF